MINVIQRLAELDADNPNVAIEETKSKKIEKLAKENNGAHGEETTSPIHGGQKKEKTMENLNLESLRYLAGVKDTIAECGMMGGSNSPATINITAGSGQELTSMLKDIMNLAGVSKVEPHHMPVDSPDAGPSTVISAPPMAGAVGHKMDPNAEMHKLMTIVGGLDQDQDSMNSGESDGEGDEKTKEGLVGGLVGGALGAAAGGPLGAATGYSAGSDMGDDLTAEDNDRMYDTSPDEKVMGDPLEQFGDINSGDHRQRQAGLPIAKPMEATFKQLFADYEKFIAEGAVTDKKLGEGDHTQRYTDLNPEKKKPGIGSKIAGAAKKVFDKIAPGDDALLTKLEKETGGKRPNRYNK